MIVPYSLNPKLAMEVVKAKKHIFIEKPMALCSQDADKMLIEAGKNGSNLMVGYMRRFDTGCEEAKKLIERARSYLGEITFARVHNFTGDWRAGFSRKIASDPAGESAPEQAANLPDFVAAKDKDVYNGTVGNFCHDINLMRFLLGDPAAVRHCSIMEGKDMYTARIAAIFDYVKFNAVFETGGIQSEWWDEEVKVYFEKGWIEIKLPPPLLQNAPARVTVHINGKGIEQLAPKWSWSFQREADHFIASIAKNQDFISSGEDSRKDLLVFEAMYRSFSSNTRVEIRNQIMSMSRKEA